MYEQRSEARRAAKRKAQAEAAAGGALQLQLQLQPPLDNVYELQRHNNIVRNRQVHSRVLLLAPTSIIQLTHLSCYSSIGPALQLAFLLHTWPRKDAGLDALSLILRN